MHIFPTLCVCCMSEEGGPITITDPKTGRTLYSVEGVGYCTSSGTMVLPLERPTTSSSSGISAWSGMNRPRTRAQEEARIRKAWAAFGGI